MFQYFFQIKSDILFYLQILSIYFLLVSYSYQISGRISSLLRYPVSGRISGCGTAYLVGRISDKNS